MEIELHEVVGSTRVDDQLNILFINHAVPLLTLMGAEESYLSPATSYLPIRALAARYEAA